MLVAAKDLRIEVRSRVVLHQIVPVAALVLLLFAFALGPDDRALRSAGAGLFWVAVLFVAVLAVQRSASIESGPGARDALRLSGLDPAGVFLGKTLAVVVELLALEVLLGVGVVLLYGTQVRGLAVLLAAAVVGTAGLAAAGTLYGGLTGGLRVRETLLPFLFLPLAAPVLVAGTRLWQQSLGHPVASGAGTTSDGSWLALLVVFAIAYVALGLLAFGPIQEAP
jgi:heme exporter protein CcmB